MSLCKRLVLVVCFCLPLLAIATPAEARVGGGNSYSSRSSSSRSSGSSRSSSSSSSRSSGSSYSGGSYSGSSYSGGGGGLGFFGIVVIFGFFGLIIVAMMLAKKQEDGSLSYGGGGHDDEGPRFAQPLPASWGARGRAIDPTFSEVLFMERAVLLVTRLFQAAPSSTDLAAMSPYVTQAAAARLAQRMMGTTVKGITVGASTIASLKSVTADGRTLLHVKLKLHLNRHVDTGGRQLFYDDHDRMLAAFVDRDAEELVRESQLHYEQLKTAIAAFRADPEVFRGQPGDG